MRRGALALDGGAAIVAVATLGAATETPTWVPVIALAVAVGAALLRARASVIRDRGLDARRESLRAFAMGDDVPAAHAVGAEARAGWRARRLFAETADDIDAYYAPVAVPGIDRLRELSAYAAHFTSRLLGLQAVVGFVVALVLGVVGALSVFGLIIEMPAPTVSKPVFDAVLGTVLGVLCVRSAAHVFDSWRAHAQMRAIADELGAPRKLPRSEIEELATKYELQVRTAPEPWTLIYEALKSTLEREWSDIRRELPRKGTP